MYLRRERGRAWPESIACSVWSFVMDNKQYSSIKSQPQVWKDRETHRITPRLHMSHFLSYVNWSSPNAATTSGAMNSQEPTFKTNTKKSGAKTAPHRYCIIKVTHKQPGAVKSVLWRHWTHATQVHPVTKENQFHCTRLHIRVHNAAANYQSCVSEKQKH